MKNKCNGSYGFMGRADASRTKIQERPYYICIVCNKCLYIRSVFLFSFDS